MPTDKEAVFGPVRLKWEGRTKARFTVPNPEHHMGQEGFYVEFGRKSIRHPDYGPVSGYGVSFYRAKDEDAPWQYKLTEDPNVNPLQVFAGVIVAVREFLTKESPPLIWFVADEAGRARLYNRLLKKMLTSGYVAEVTGDGKYTIISEKERDYRLQQKQAVKTKPSFPNPSDTQQPTNPSLWERVLELARGDSSEYTSGGKTIHSPNKGRGYYPWPQPNGIAWAVKQYKGLGGQFAPTKEATMAQRVVARHQGL